MTSRTPGVLLLGHPVLRRIAESVSKSDLESEEFMKGVERLQATLEDFRKRVGFGRAIAAPQIGISKRFIAFHIEDRSFVMFNPKIIWKSKEMKEMYDDCMSFPDIMVLLDRHESISVEYMNEKFEVQKLEKLDFKLSELIQHEYDHLDGILAIDRVKPGKDGIVYREAYNEFFKK